MLPNVIVSTSSNTINYCAKMPTCSNVHSFMMYLTRPPFQCLCSVAFNVSHFYFLFALKINIFISYNLILFSLLDIANYSPLKCEHLPEVPRQVNQSWGKTPVRLSSVKSKLPVFHSHHDDVIYDCVFTFVLPLNNIDDSYYSYAEPSKPLKLSASCVIV